MILHERKIELVSARMVIGISDQQHTITTTTLLLSYFPFVGKLIIVTQVQKPEVVATTPVAAQITTDMQLKRP